MIEKEPSEHGDDMDSELGPAGGAAADVVAGWANLKPSVMADEEVAAVALPWIQRPLNWSKIRNHAEQFTAIISDDDQYVSVEDGKIFAHQLGAKLVVEHHKRHLGGEDGVMVLTSVARALDDLMET